MTSFWRKSPATWDPLPIIPPGHRLYAVGDVHGHDELLSRLIEMIEGDIAARGPAEVTIIFLGDLIDRGPRSAEVVERLRTYAPTGIRIEFLCGNHEEVLLRILNGDSGLVSNWLRFGGDACARSYGLDPDTLAALPPAEAVTALRSAIPAAHQSFLSSFADTFSAGDYLFVHAGIRPGVPLARQTQADLRWIRKPFIDHVGRHEVMVVHGHTIRPEVDEAAGRIGIDTGAYLHGVMTAIALEGDERWILQSRQ